MASPSTQALAISLGAVKKGESTDPTFQQVLFFLLTPAHHKVAWGALPITQEEPTRQGGFRQVTDQRGSEDTVPAPGAWPTIVAPLPNVIAAIQHGEGGGHLKPLFVQVQETLEKQTCLRIRIVTVGLKSPGGHLSSSQARPHKRRNTAGQRSD